jgi:hypothetical protein
MALEEKLRQIYDRLEKDCRCDLQRQIRVLAKLTRDALKDDSWRDVSAGTDGDIRDAALEARRLARILDATSYLDDKVIRSKFSTILDVRLKSDLKSVQEQILDMFETRQAPHRGFVYVAWSARPEEYWYIGKANTSSRLNLVAHGKLARATAHATQLSLVFPTQSRQDILEGVEAALLALIEAYMGEPPKLNDRREMVIENKGTEELRLLANFLGSIADDLHYVRTKRAA